MVRKLDKGIIFATITLLIIIVILSAFIKIKNSEINKVCFENKCFLVELATTSEERSNGLMFRNNLEENEGMLFIFTREDYYGFWMKNTLIPLDIVWISKEGKVVHVEENVQPCAEEICNSYYPLSKALYVLEVNSGMASGIQIGYKINFS